MIDAMGGKCQICDYNKCQEAMDFHHINPLEKEFSFNRARANPKAIKKIIEELKKCVLLCSRCHREVHAGVAVCDSNITLDIEKLSSELDLKRKLKIHQANSFINKPDKNKILLTNDQLVDMLQEHNGNKSSLARYLKVSETAIRKRLKQSIPV